jgi:hypothetical protein
MSTTKACTLISWLELLQAAVAKIFFHEKGASVLILLASF